MSTSRLSVITQNPDDLKTLGIRNKGSVVLGSGFLNKFKDSPRHKYSKKLSSINLLYVGRLLKSKGITEVINIFKKLSGGSTKFKLTIVGDVDEENPNSINESDLNYIKESELIDYVGFVDNLHEIYSKSDILLFPSNYREGVPRVIIEALSYGITIVTNNLPGCKECVTNNGILINENNLKNVIDYLKCIDHKILKSNSLISKNLFESKFSSKVIYPQYEKIILNEF